MSERGKNPYQYVRHCLMGKWKMSILHYIHYAGVMRFNEALKILPVTEKVLAQQLRELVEDGLVERIPYDTLPPKVEYVLTELGKKLIPALDTLYIWSIRRLYELGETIDSDAFLAHDIPPYSTELKDIYEALGVRIPTSETARRTEKTKKISDTEL